MTDRVSDRVGELILPALRWNATERAYQCEGATVAEALEARVGGFCLFGGTSAAARALVADLTARSRVPLLIASDLERGAGQQLEGLTGLPPLAALASLDDEAVMRRAGRLTAREARSVGVNWVLGPVLDLDVEPDNPIVGTRAIGRDAQAVARLGVAWVEGCQGERVMACAKHFPGHGRTTVDSHAALPVVRTSRVDLEATDLVPFRAAVDANVAAVMSAHVAFPALDPTGDPATLSRPMLRSLLRRDFAFEGLIVTDAMIMEGLAGGRAEGDAAARALGAGIDILLYPRSLAEARAGLIGAIGRGELAAEHVQQALDRRARWLGWTRASASASPPDDDDKAWAWDIGQRVIRPIRGVLPSLADQRVDVMIVDDDVGGPYPAPSREPFIEALYGFGVDVRVVEEASAAPLIVALFGDIRAWKGRPGYSERAREAVRRAVAESPSAVVVQFSHPRLAAQLEAPNVVCTWGGEATMQRAAAAWLAAGV